MSENREMQANNLSNQTYNTGLSRVLIPIRSRGVGMMGYGMLHNVVEGMSSDLYIRAMVLSDQQGKTLAYANAEICFVTLALRTAVLERLQNTQPDMDWREENLLLTAQHTHSAPGGYSHYFFYNVTMPGFQPEVFEAIVSAFTDAIIMAQQNQAPAHLDFIQGAFEPDLEVGFNRSLSAYNKNPEVKPFNDYETHLAIDRNMYLLRVRSPEGHLRGIINWFGVHATSVGPKNRRISSDNKGYAATFLEQNYHHKQGNTDFVGIFAQAAAGDVSPNFHGKGLNWPKGKFEDDLESARFNGKIQFHKALELSESPSSFSLQGQLDAEMIYADFSKQSCDSLFTGGLENCQTSESAHGVAFFKGTAVDGKGVSDMAGTLLAAMARRLRKVRLNKAEQASPEERQRILNKFAAQDPKEILIDSGDKQFLGITEVKDLPIPDFLDPVLGEVKRLHRIEAIQEHSWTPQVLPVQVFVLGNLALAGVPGEITTIAAQRLRLSLEHTLAKKGVKQVIIGSYANAYHGYITTAEEYSLQNYEGGHTVFGKWTLAAFQTVFDTVARALLLPIEQRNLPKTLKPPVFSERELALRTFHPDQPKIRR
jgi:neutral ceramidase